MHVEPRHTAEELDSLTRQQSRAAPWRRFRALTLAQAGQTAEAIADALGCTVRAVQKWVARYNAAGPDALADRPVRGRKPRFDPDGHDRLRRRIEAGPTLEDDVCAFHGPDIRRIARDESGVELGPRAVYDLLHRIGLSSPMSRPVHRKSDTAAQEAIGKGLPGGLDSSPRPTPPSGSRCGSPTRPASAGRAR